MTLTSLPNLRFKANIAPLIFLVLVSLAGSGCTDSKDETDKQEQPVARVQEPAVSPPKSSVLQKEEKVTLADIKSDPIRLQAQEQLTQGNEAVEKAEQLLRRAPMGKESDLALSALQRNLDSARNLLRTGQTHFDEKKFEMAQTQAHQATEKASAVYEHIEQAISAVNVDSR
ncbi:MAG: hypothetical protein ABIP82_02100 [Nitrospirales bacterium]